MLWITSKQMDFQYINSYGFVVYEHPTKLNHSLFRSVVTVFLIAVGLFKAPEFQMALIRVTFSEINGVDHASLEERREIATNF